LKKDQAFDAVLQIASKAKAGRRG
jgi:hypothetical protein